MLEHIANKKIIPTPDRLSGCRNDSSVPLN